MAPKPLAPVALTVVAIQPREVRLAWTDPSGVELWFYVERATGTGAFVHEATLPKNRTAYVALELTPSTRYQFRVRASNNAGTSPYSNTVTAFTSSRRLVSWVFPWFVQPTRR